METADHFKGNYCHQGTQSNQSKSIYKKDKPFLADSQRTSMTVRSKSREELRMVKSRQLDRVD